LTAAGRVDPVRKSLSDSHPSHAGRNIRGTETRGGEMVRSWISHKRPFGTQSLEEGIQCGASGLEGVIQRLLHGAVSVTDSCT
jgi:hypothetical protein